MQNKILLLLLLAGAIFFLAPIDRVEAQEVQYGCENLNTGSCDNVLASNPSEARSRCIDICIKLFPNDINTKCNNLNTLTDPRKPCPLPTQLSCIKNGKECKDLVAKFHGDDAEDECVDFCGANSINCVVQEGACATGLAGADAEELQKKATGLNKLGITNPAQLVGRFINILLAFIGSIALVLYIYSGFLWMTASGNTEQVGKAKTTMVWTTLGVAMMLASYMLASFIFKSLGV